MRVHHPKMAERWAHHTKNMKKLPEHKSDKSPGNGAGKADAAKTAADEELARRAFCAAFVEKCAAAGVTAPAAVAAAARAEAERLTRMRKQADPASAALSAAGTTAGDLLGRATVLPLVGSVGLPLAAGFAGGAVAGKSRNVADDDDAETLRIRAAANAYRRRAAEATAHAEVRKLVATDPDHYVPL